MSYIDESRVMLKYMLPLSEVIVDFFDELKSQSSGYARFVQRLCFPTHRFENKCIYCEMFFSLQL